MTDIRQVIASKLYQGEKEDVAQLVQQALDQGMGPGEILSDTLMPGMDQVGQDFKAGELFVPEVLMAAQAMKAGLSVLRPLLTESDAMYVGTCVIGTVEGDLHDIGKNLVGMMLEGASFEVVDLGAGVNPGAFVDAVRERHPKLVGMSALLTTTMVNMKATIDALEEAGLRDTVKVMVGGAPVTEVFAQQIGADGYASDAASAVEIARSLIA